MLLARNAPAQFKQRAKVGSVLCVSWCCLYVAQQERSLANGHREIMDLVQLREEILSKDLPPMKKAEMFMKHKATLNLNHLQWLFFTYPLPKEVAVAMIFLSCHRVSSSFWL